MEELNFELIKKRSSVPEIKRTIELAEKNGVDVSRGIKELKKAISVAEQVSSSKIVDEFLMKAKRELDRSLTDFVLMKYYDLEKEIRDDGLSNREIEICMHSAFSAVGIKHYELALKDIKKCKDELENLKKPKFERAQATEMVKCSICMGKIKVGFPMIKCACGSVSHEPCAMRAGKCGCGVVFKQA